MKETGISFHLLPTNKIELSTFICKLAIVQLSSSLFLFRNRTQKQENILSRPDIFYSYILILAVLFAGAFQKICAKKSAI